MLRVSAAGGDTPRWEGTPPARAAGRRSRPPAPRSRGSILRPTAPTAAAARRASQPRGLPPREPCQRPLSLPEQPPPRGLLSQAAACLPPSAPLSTPHIDASPQGPHPGVLSQTSASPSAQGTPHPFTSKPLCSADFLHLGAPRRAQRATS